MKDTPIPESIPNEQALAQQLSAMRQQRAEACWQEITAVLQRHGCDLAAVISTSPDRRSAVAHPIVTVK